MARSATGKLGWLCRLAEGLRLEGEYRAMSAGYDGGDLGDYLVSVGGRYAKVWYAYLAERDSLATLRDASGVLRHKVKALLEERGMSAYRLFGDAGVCRSVGCAWLRGDDKAISSLAALGLYVFLSGDEDLKASLEQLRELG